MRQLRLIFIALLVALSAHISAQSAPAAADRATLLREAVDLFTRAVEQDHIRGAVLYAAQRGEVVLHEAVGLRHLPTRAPMEKDTLFRMASNTKPVIATAIMMLAEEGKLSIDDTVARHLKAFDNNKSRNITIAQLLSHSSGLRIEPIFYPFKPGEEVSLQAAVAKFGAEGPQEKPGAYSYNNAGYNTLGAVIEVVSGMPLERFLVTRIYEPLGMRDTLNHADETKLQRMATVYRGRPGRDGKVAFTQGFTPGDPPDYPVVRASGGMISTAADYAKFLEMFRSGGSYNGTRLLKEESVKAMLVPRAKSSDTSSYGFGWILYPDGSYHHTGSDGTLAWIDPARGIVGMVLTQSPGGLNPRNEFRQKIVQAVSAPRDRATADAAGPSHWPRFRGPNSNPTSENRNLPVSWSKTENVEWVADVAGVGWSSPVVWGNRVFITSATGDKPMKPPSLGVDFSNEYLAELRKQGLSSEEINKKLYERDREMPHEIVISLMLYCYDLETGKKVWERQLYHGRPAGGRHSKNSYASETPTTDGKRVYVYSADYGLFALDLEGKPSWATPLKSHTTTRDWGTGASAALHKDRLFVLNDNEEQSFVAAFDTATGKELWRTPRTVQPARKMGWSTPFVWENRLRTELVTLGPGVVISYGLDGRELWRLNRMGGVAIQSPFAWNDLLYVTSGSGADDNKPIVAIRAGGSGDITPPGEETRNDHVAWYDRMAGGTYLPTPVIYKDALYVLNDKGILSRRNAATGERTYQSRVAPGASAFTASPWAYNDHVFVMSEEGDTFVIEAANEYRLVRTNSLDDFSMATPAIVGDRLLIRTQHRLYSIRNRK